MKGPLQTAATPMAAFLLVFSVFLLLRGHDLPGGGFVAGLVAAASIELLALAHGREHGVPRPVRSPRKLIVIGFIIAFAAGAMGWFAGAFLQALWLPGSYLGYKLGTPVLFDTGIALLVAGSASTILSALEDAE